jgi:hypothetical protein
MRGARNSFLTERKPPDKKIPATAPTLANKSNQAMTRSQTETSTTEQSEINSARKRSADPSPTNSETANMDQSISVRSKTRKVDKGNEIQESAIALPTTDNTSFMPILNNSMDNIEIESNHSGVISPTPSHHSQEYTRPVKQKAPYSANVNFDVMTASNNYPDSTREVFLTSISTPICHLSKINPIKVATEIDRICGEVLRVAYKPSGSLLITTKDINQVRKLLKTTIFNNIPVQASIAWTSQTSQGKIYAPEFLQDSLEDLLDLLRPNGVVGIRKLLQDPAKANAPLYVLTFLNTCRPTKLKIGYCQYNVDPYYPSPSRCNKCCRWSHTTKVCRSPQICNNCGAKDHLSNECIALNSKCANCSGPHKASSKECPKYKIEKDIYEIATDQGISLKDARRIISGTGPELNNEQRAPPNVQSSLAFPALSQRRPTHASHHQPAQRTPVHVPQPTASASHQLSQTPYVDIVSQTQESAWLTQGQRSRDTQERDQYPRANYHPSSQVEQNLSFDLPPLDFITNTAGDPPDRYSLQPNPPKYYSQAASQATASTDTIPADLKKFLLQFTSLILELFFSNDLTDKIKCSIEIGSILNSESTIHDLLTRLGITSRSNSQ